MSGLPSPQGIGLHLAIYSQTWDFLNCGVLIAILFFRLWGAPFRMELRTSVRCKCFFFCFAVKVFDLWRYRVD